MFVGNDSSSPRCYESVCVLVGGSDAGNEPVNYAEHHHEGDQCNEKEERLRI
jgi:hypothetical protein